MKAGRGEQQGIRVVVLEDDPLRFIGLRTLLESEPDFELISVGMGALDTLHDHDVVLLTPQNGRDVASLVDGIQKQKAGIRIIMTGSEVGDEAVLKALAAGAKGYVHQATTAEELTRAIRVVHRGLIWAPRRVFSTLIDRATVPLSGGFVRDRLTSREKDVLEMLVAGRSNKEIAGPLGIEERTVKSHVAKLMRKIGVKNRVKLSVHAITHSLVAAK